MNFSPKSRCHIRRSVNNRASAKLVTPKFPNLPTLTKAAKITGGPLARAFLSQGRSSETRPLGNVVAARRVGDLRTLLAIQSQRPPGPLLSSKSHHARTAHQEKCYAWIDDKSLKTKDGFSSSLCNADSSPPQRDRSSTSSGGRRPDFAEQLSTSGWELELVSGLKSSQESKIFTCSGQKFFGDGGTDKSGENDPSNLFVEESGSHQHVFSDGCFSQGGKSGNCECSSFSFHDGRSHRHGSVELRQGGNEKSFLGNLILWK